MVAPGWVTPDAFLAGYGAAQALPGPLFSFGAYLGAVSTVGPGGVAGSVLATVAIFLPGMLLVLAALPVLRRLRGRAGIAAALAGTNAVVVGLLAAALITPVATGGLTSIPAVGGRGAGHAGRREGAAARRRRRLRAGDGRGRLSWGRTQVRRTTREGTGPCGVRPAAGPVTGAAAA